MGEVAVSSSIYNYVYLALVITDQLMHVISRVSLPLILLIHLPLIEQLGISVQDWVILRGF